MRVNLLFGRRGLSKGFGAVEIEVSENGKRKRFATGVKVKPNQWAGGKVKGKDAVSLNLRINEMFDKVTEAVGTYGFDRLTAALVNGKKEPAETAEAPGFMDWLAEGVENRADISEGTAKHYRSFAAYLRRLGIFQKFTDLTVKNVAEMDADLRKRGLGKSTIYNYHKWMRYWCGVAVREDLLAKSPYANFHCDKGHRDTIRYLTPEERDKVEALPLIGTAAMVRDMFIFSCYTGLSYSDMAKIVPEDFKHTNGRISLRSHRVKTGGLYSLTILPKAQAILERYGWRLPDISDQKCNQWLKIIQGQARITTKMTMHVARHTFATWALSEGVSVEVVSKMLGHANIATTQIYAKVLQRSVDEGFDMLAQ